MCLPFTLDVLTGAIGFLLGQTSETEVPCQSIIQKYYLQFKESCSRQRILSNIRFTDCVSFTSN